MPYDDIDIDALRARFPALRAGVAHFDGPGGTQTPTPVIEAITHALSAPLSVRGSVAPGEINAETIVRDFRRAMADLLGADEAGIVVGRSATQLTYDFSRVLARGWAPGDEVIVSRLRPRRQHPPLGPGGRTSGCGGALGGLRSGHRRAALRHPSAPC